MSESNRFVNPSSTLTLVDLERAVAEMGPPRRATIRVHRMSRPALDVLIAKALSPRTVEDPGIRILGIPIVENEFLSKGVALLIKEIQRHGLWECEGMVMLELEPGALEEGFRSNE